MKEIIEKMKKDNSNESFSQRDLLWYIINRVDCLNRKLDKKMDKKTVYWLIGGLFTLILFTLGIIVNGVLK